MAELPKTIPGVVAQARQNLTPEHWDYATGGADSEVTLRRNRTAFEQIAFRPRMLRNVSKVSTATTFLGQRLSLPVMLAPVGSVEHFHEQGALACARAGNEVGTATFVGSLSAPSLEDVRAGADGPLFFQVYMAAGREWYREIAGRADQAGYLGICITVDSAAYSRRERDLHNGFIPMTGMGRPNLGGLASRFGQSGIRLQSTITWEDLKWIREDTRLPLMLKGIQTAEDAVLAVEHGVDVIYVSNHGSRQLDHASSPIEILPEILQAVNGRARVIVDSGFMRGSDVLKAIALGADAVLIGKLMLYGLACGREAGLVRVLDLLKVEMETIMMSLGVTNLSELNTSYLRQTFVPAEAPWPYY